MINDGTDLASAQANQLESSNIQMNLLNENLKAQYLQRFANWKISVDAGKIDNKQPPEPPLGYGLVEASGFVYPLLGAGPAICEMPPIPEDHTAAQPAQPAAGNDSVMFVPPGDHFPVGFEVTAPDGSVWQKQSSITPFGTAYYYAKVGSEAHVKTPIAHVAVWGT